MQEHPQSFPNKPYDVFISHATEDKEDFVRPLAESLIEMGIKVWFDAFELRVGDSLRQKIDEGLTKSRFGVTVFSPTFFKKHWTQYEMDGLIARQTAGERAILPIWHRIMKSDILNYAPSLTDIVSLNSSTQTLEEIACEIAKAIAIPETTVEPPQSIHQAHYSSPNFAVFYIAPAHTPELPRGQNPQPAPMISLTSRPTGWFSMVSRDEELEYHIQDATLRVRLDWGNHRTGDEMTASQLVSGDQPFALLIRPNNTEQIYYPSVVNTSPQRLWRESSRSGWLVFKIQ